MKLSSSFLSAIRVGVETLAFEVSIKGQRLDHSTDKVPQKTLPQWALVCRSLFAAALVLPAAV